MFSSHPDKINRFLAMASITLMVLNILVLSVTQKWEKMIIFTCTAGLHWICMERRLAVARSNKK